MKKLDRYLIEEIVPLLLAGTLTVVVLFLVAAFVEVLAPILAKGANPVLVAKLIAYSLPEAMARGLPIALLFAVLLGLSRLAADSEIKSMLTGGIAPSRMMWVVLLLSSIVAVASFVNGETLVPSATQKALQTQRDIVLDNPRVMVQEKTVFKDANNRAIYIEKISPGNVLEGIQIIQMGLGQPPKEVITAEKGYLDAASATLILEAGERITYRDARPLSVAQFNKALLPLQDLQASFNGKDGVRPVNLPLRELYAKLRDLKQRQFPAYQEETAFWRKFAEPLAAIAFGFFAVTLAMFSFKRSSSVGLMWVMLITFTYYATWSVFRVMGEQGAVAGWLAAFAPNVIYTVSGLILLVLSHRK